MKFIANLVGAAVATVAFTNIAFAAPDTFNTQQTQAIQEIVHKYLVDNPSVIVEVVKKLQQQQQQGMQKNAVTAIKKNANKLFANPNSPVAGNPNGKVTLVEFFDYQCGHCKQMTPVVASLIKANPQLRVVYKEFPIFPGSDAMAKSALAAQKQGKYLEFHEALMSAPNPVKKEDVMKIAAKVGLNGKQLQEIADSASVKQEVKDNYALAESLGLQGTPAFIVTNSKTATPQMKVFFVPGGAEQSKLQGFIDQASK